MTKDTCTRRHNAKVQAHESSLVPCAESYDLSHDHDSTTVAGVVCWHFSQEASLIALFTIIESVHS